MKTGYRSTSKVKNKPSVTLGYTMPEQSPTLWLTEKELPEIKDWKVGGTYQIALTVKEVAVSQDSRDSYPEKRATFEIKKAEVEEKDS